MTDRYERIRAALAMGPTPGPWKAHDPSESGWVDITNAPYATPLCYALPHSEPLVDDSGYDFEQWVSHAHETPANAAHIAACDPDTIRALLAERDALAATLAATEAARDGYRDDARQLHAALVRMVAQYESEFDHEDTHKWRPEWLRAALAKENRNG